MAKIIRKLEPKGLALHLPNTKEGVASLGLRVATRMAADEMNETTDQVLLSLSVRLNCNLNQLHHYHDTMGLPDFMVDWAVNFFKDCGVYVGRHQLKPTKAVLSLYGIE